MMDWHRIGERIHTNLQFSDKIPHQTININKLPYTMDRKCFQNVLPTFEDLVNHM